MNRYESLAQAERRAIYERTKAALQIAKRNSVTLGNPRLTEAEFKRNVPESVKKATAARIGASIGRAAKVMKVIEKAREQGAHTLQSIADYLNEKTSIARLERACGQEPL
ncbi:MAG: hypothetical protein A6F72_02605 [Cycloclasticus sp. symbiont of Poecilosclerida sp. N]|nr:MAG: hypothetical protein A6F72_02605 [Cycloclasticus sp. symbiont of Poecilosclerida sp. N]